MSQVHCRLSIVDWGLGIVRARASAFLSQLHTSKKTLRIHGSAAWAIPHARLSYHSRPAGANLRASNKTDLRTVIGRRRSARAEARGSFCKTLLVLAVPLDGSNRFEVVGRQVFTALRLPRRRSGPVVAPGAAVVWRTRVARACRVQRCRGVARAEWWASSSRARGD